MFSSYPVYLPAFHFIENQNLKIDCFRVLFGVEGNSHQMIEDLII